MIRHLAATLILVLAAMSGAAQGQTALRSPETGRDFWSVPRHGTNSFNKVETPAHIQAAGAFGVGFLRMAFGKWQGTGRDFLAGDLDHYEGLQSADVAHLRALLDAAALAGVPVMLTPLDLPGARWRQNNDDRVDDRLWTDKTWWDVSARYWSDIAREFAGHPGLVGYNILNEPVPELGHGPDETAATQDQQDAWCAQVRGTARDLNGFYHQMVAAIRAVDPDTPIILDGGWYAKPTGVQCLTAIDDPHVLYAMHMYEPYRYTTGRLNGGRLSYPGVLPYAGREERWDADRVARHLQPMFDWADRQGVARNRIILGEFGGDRQVQGCAAYLTDVMAAAEAGGAHWAFYSFREDVWDAMDYELGDGPTPQGFYWAGRTQDLPRPVNPMSEALRAGLARGRTD